MKMSENQQNALENALEEKIDGLSENKITQQNEIIVPVHYSDVEKFVYATKDNNEVHTSPESAKNMLRTMKFREWEKLDGEVIVQGMLALLKTEHELGELEKKALSYYEVNFQNPPLIKRVENFEHNPENEKAKALVRCSFTIYDNKECRTYYVKNTAHVLGEEKQLLEGTFAYSDRQIGASELENKMIGTKMGELNVCVGELRQYLGIMGVSNSFELKFVSSLIPYVLAQTSDKSPKEHLFFYLSQSLNFNNGNEITRKLRRNNEVKFSVFKEQELGNPNSKQSVTLNVCAYLPDGTPLFYGQAKGIVKKLK